MATDDAPYADLLRRRGRAVVALPAEDAVIDAAPAALRRAVGETWHRRSHEELKAAMAFTLLSRELLEIGAPPDAMTRVARAVGDEVRHAEALRALSSRYLGEEATWPPAVPVEAARSLEGDEPRVRASLHAVALGCVNETIASVFIEASHDAAESPSARATLGLILADEVEHGRAGWVYLAGARDDAAVMRAVQRELGRIVERIAGCWFDDAAITIPEGAPAHGLLSNADTHRCVVTALRELVVPGFAQLGLDATEASRVAERLAS
jgi:hypothetical protein